MVRFAIQQAIEIVSGSVKQLRRKKLPEPFFETKFEAFLIAMQRNFNNLKILISLRQQIKPSKLKEAEKEMLLDDIKSRIKFLNKQEGFTRTEHRRLTRERKRRNPTLKTALNRKNTRLEQLRRATN